MLIVSWLYRFTWHFPSVSQTNSMYTKQVQYNCFNYNIFFYALKTIVVFSLMNE